MFPKFTSRVLAMNRTSANFYKLIGFVPYLSDEEEIADFPTLPPHAHMMDSEFVNLVLVLENMLRKAGFSRIDCSLSDTRVEQSAPASLSTLLVYCCFPPPKCTSEANLEACCNGLVIIGLIELLCIQPEHPTFYKPMGYAGKGFVKGDTRIQSTPLILLHPAPSNLCLDIFFDRVYTISS